jgi:hypothetical protein
MISRQDCGRRWRRSVSTTLPWRGGATCGTSTRSARADDLRALVDPPPPSDPDELAALLDVEERLGAIDPYR